jgi:hypothetical protein
MLDLGSRHSRLWAFAQFTRELAAVLYSSPKAAAVVSGMIFFVKNQSAFEGVRFLRLGRRIQGGLMCRNIKTLFNFDPPVTDDEVRAASLQFVRKISGFTKPSKANEAAFLAAVDEVASVSTRLLHSLETVAPPKNREEEAAKAKARAAERFGA